MPVLGLISPVSTIRRLAHCWQTMSYDVIVTVVSLEDIQRDLQGYLHRVEAGETVVIMRAGNPVAEIRPVMADLFG